MVVCMLHAAFRAMLDDADALNDSLRRLRLPDPKISDSPVREIDLYPGGLDGELKRSPSPPSESKSRSPEVRIGTARRALMQEEGEADGMRSTLKTTSCAAHSLTKHASKELRGKLTRRRTNQNPLQNYDVTTILGVGSMGSVAQVRKRTSAIGRSARKGERDRAQRERQRCQACFTLPFIQYCWNGRRTTMADEGANFHDIEWKQAPSVDGTEETSSSLSSCKEMIFAMKTIHLNRFNDEDFVEELKNEIEILKTLDHPHIVRAIETYEHRKQLFVVMELCSGGDLYSRDPYTEEQAARITASILSAIAYMHSKNM